MLLTVLPNFKKYYPEIDPKIYESLYLDYYDTGIHLIKNGKLIQCFFNKDINIKIERHIKCHNGRINGIEINKKFGLIITCGDDNYILIRKLYDFELLSPIKIKHKYIITLAKVSPLNFLYVLCYDKHKNSKVIFGYTLNGLKFAKSDYGNYENFDFIEKTFIPIEKDNYIQMSEFKINNACNRNQISNHHWAMVNAIDHILSV